MRGGVLAGMASGAALVGILTVSASLLLPPPAGPVDAASPSGTVPVAPGSGPVAGIRPTSETATVVPDPAPASAAADILPAQSVRLPSGSEFGRPPPDEAVSPGEPDAPSPATAPLDRLATAPERGSIAPVPVPASTPRPAPADVSHLASAPNGAADPGRPSALPDTAPTSPPFRAASMPADAATPDPAPTVPVILIPAAPETAATPDIATVPAVGAPETASEGDARQAEPMARPGVTLVPPAEVLSPPSAASPSTATPQVAPGPQAVAVPPRRLVLDSARTAPSTAAPIDAGQAIGGDALAANAVPFEDATGLPRLAIVLFDIAPDAAGDADDAARDTVGPGALAGLDVVVTIAIDPTRPDATAAARAWRGAGHEVVLLFTDPVPGATAQDVEVALAGARAAVPQAVGLLDGGQGDSAEREARAALMPALAAAGLGFVGPADGLGSDVVAARGAGIPARSLYRMLDGTGESVAVIVRYLDRAAFEADRTGGIVVSGHATARMLEALRAWQGGARAKSVVTAPLSAVLTDERDGTPAGR